MTDRTRRWIRRGTAAAMVLLSLAVIGIAAHRLRGGRPRLLRLLPRAAGETAPGEGRAIGLSSGFEHLESLAGEPVFLLRAARMLGLESGWYRLENVTLTLYRTGVGAAVIQCDTARFHAARRDAELSGSVHVELAGGEFLDAPAGTLDAARHRFVTGGEVFFGGVGFVGRAPRVVYELDSERLVLPEGLEVLGDDGTALRAPVAEYRRPRLEVVFPLGVTATLAGGGRVRADRGVVRLEPGTRRVVEIDLGGGVQLRMPPGPGRGPVRARAGRVTLRREATLEWQGTAGPEEDGWVELVALEGTGYAERRLRTWRLRFVAEGGILLGARMEGIVCLAEIPDAGPARRGEARNGTLYFSQGTPSDVDLEGEVRLESGGWRANGVRARFTSTEGVAVLQGDPAHPGSRAHVAGDGSELWAEEVQLHDREGTLIATGDVQGTSSHLGLMSRAGEGGGEGPVRFAAGVFEGSEGGDLLVLRRGARVWQGRRLLLADEIRAHRTGRWLEARGSVRLTLPDPGSGGEVLVVARTVRYDESSGIAVFRGAVRLSDPTAILTAAELEARLGPSGTVEGFEAREGVVVEEVQQARRLRGDLARYGAREGTLVVTGSPATLVDPKGNVVSGSSLTWHRPSGTVTVAGAEGTPTETIYHPEEGEG